MRLPGFYVVAAGALLLLVVAAGPLALRDSPTSLLHGDRLERDAASPEGWALDGHPVRFVLGRDLALDPATEALLVLAPEVGYTTSEVRAIRAFLFDGGRLLVAGERGAGKQLLDDLGVGVTLTGTSLYSPAFRDDPDRIIAQSTGAIARLPSEVLVHGATLVAGGVPVLRAPDPVWADENANGRPDVEETTVPGVVAARGAFGAGEVLVLGDRLLFHEAPLDVRAALLDHVAEGQRRLVLDEAHRTSTDPFGLAPVLEGSAGTVASTAILMMAAAVAAAAVLRPRLVRTRGKRAARAVAAPSSDRVREVLVELDSS